MTPTARTVLPTDLVALVSYDGRVYANEVMTLDRTGTQDSPHPLETAFEQWFSFATGRHTWISVKGATLRGLVSARKRGSKLAWEIDCLIDAGEDDRGVIMSLLDQVTEAAGKSGALKIFVRVPAGGALEEDVARNAFAPYRHETLYRLNGAPSAFAPAPGLRRREKEDLQPIFQLYTASVPESIRRYEAMTLSEFTAAQERLGRTSQYVLPGEGGRTAGWLRVARDGDIGRFDFIGEGAAVDALIDSAMAKVAQRECIVALLPDYQQDVARRLEEVGFEAQESYTVLARRTVRPVKDAVRAVARVQTTFG